MADPYAPPKPPPQPMAQQPNQFDAMRRRLQSTNQLQLGKAQDQQNEALNRKFAAGGIANSGAAIRAQQLGNQELQGQFGDQLNQQQGAIDQMEAGQNFQSAEAQKARDLQESQFGRSFGLDSEMKRAQLGLANREFGLKEAEQNFNIGGTLNDRGYGVDMSQFAPTNARDSSGRLINPNGQGLGYEENLGMYSADIMRRRAEEEERKRQAYSMPPPLQSNPFR